MSPNPTRVLLVARQSFVEPLSAELRRETTVVECASELKVSEAASFGVVVVESGFGDWQSVVETGASVILFADHADGITVATALAEGADDVITRADRPHEAVARIRAVARRRPKQQSRTAFLCVGDVELDPEGRRVTVGGDPIKLTRKQFDLLEFFLRNAGRVVTRDALLRHVWDIAATQDLNAVEVQVRRLREALGDHPPHPKRLRTVRGVGYLYER